MVFLSVRWRDEPCLPIPPPRLQAGFSRGGPSKFVGPVAVSGAWLAGAFWRGRDQCPHVAGMDGMMQRQPTATGRRPTPRWAAPARALAARARLSAPGGRMRSPIYVTRISHGGKTKRKGRKEGATASRTRLRMDAGRSYYYLQSQMALTKFGSAARLAG